MIEISSHAEAILQNFRRTYVNKKTPQEHGRSAFWLWYDKIQTLIQSLEQIRLPLGSKQTYNMEYWGNIIYTHLNLPNIGSIIIIEDFQFDMYNFTNWLNHAPLNEVPFTRKLNKEETWVNQERPIHSILNKELPTYQPLGVKGIYKLQTSSGKWYVCDKHLNPIGNKYLYDDIKRFQRHKDGTYAIGIIQNQSWKIGTNGLIIQPNTNISIDSKGNYVAANGDGADYVSESKKTNKRIIRKKRNIDSIITEVLNDFLRREVVIA